MATTIGKATGALLVLEELVQLAGADSAEPQGDPVRDQAGLADQGGRRAALQRVPRGQPDGAGARAAHRRPHARRVAQHPALPRGDAAAATADAARRRQARQGARDLRDRRVRHPAPAEPDRADPRRRGEEERVGAALDNARAARRRAAPLGLGRQVLRRRRRDARRLLPRAAGVQRKALPRRPAAVPRRAARRPRAREPPGVPRGAPEQPARLPAGGRQVTGVAPFEIVRLAAVVCDSEAGIRPSFA